MTTGGVDPNLFASLAVAYAGGIRAPVTGQEGYRAQVDATGTNIEYVSDFQAALAGYEIRDESGVAIGRCKASARRITTSATAVQTIATFEPSLGGGISYTHYYVVARKIEGQYYCCDGLAVAIYVAGVGSTILQDAPGTASTTLVGTHLVAIVDATGVLHIEANSNVADGAVAWTCVMVTTEFYA
jgi:hypothetical protein